MKDSARKRGKKPQLPPKPGQLSAKVEPVEHSAAVKEDQVKHLQLELDEMRSEFSRHQQGLSAVEKQVVEVIVG